MESADYTTSNQALAMNGLGDPGVHEVCVPALVQRHTDQVLQDLGGN
jgi:hypothetical protein